MANETDLQMQDAEKQEIEQSEGERTRSGAAFVPQSDIYETEDAIHVAVDVPGVREDSVDITLEQNILTINGYVEPEQYEGYQPAYAEYRVGDYERRFIISNEIDRNKIEATMKDGVLHLTLPKSQPENRKISVKSA